MDKDRGQERRKDQVGMRRVKKKEIKRGDIDGKKMRV